MPSTPTRSLSLTEARQRAAHLEVRSYAVELDLTDAAGFGSRTTVRFSSTAPETFVELAGATALTASLDGIELPGEAYREGRLRLTGLTGSTGSTGPTGPVDHELVVDARLPYVVTGDGMHRTTDPADGAAYVGAYCGMDLAHHVFACFDQPDLKAPITLQVTADPAWTVLANGVGETAGPGRWSFATTPPISTYLFVVCAGPWHSVAFEHHGLPFAWHARASLAGDLDAVVGELRRITTTCFDHYVGAFSSPYPFDSYDQVFGPGLNWGAMEFPGCVVFSDELLPRGEASALQRETLASVIAHEMAHMWFGDLVTMRWWEDSWLNESFADYMGYAVADAAAGYTGSWTDCVLLRTPTGYAADERRSTHPVAEETEAMVDVDTAFGNFDMITYAKGNAVLRQLATWLGEETFLAGADRHLSAHAFGNADLEDFLGALDAVSDRDVRGWAALWLRTTGFDTLRVTRVDDVPVLTREGSRPHRVGVSAYDDDGALVGSRLVDVGAEPVALTDLGGLAVVPNSGAQTFARIRLDPGSALLVDRRLSAVAEPLTRGLLWATATDECRTGERTVGALLGLAARHLPPERHPVVFEGALSSVAATVSLLADPVDVPEAARTLAAACHLALEVADRPEAPGVGLAATRMLARTSDDSARLEAWLDEGLTDHGRLLDQELRWDVVRRLAQLGAPVELVAAELARDRTSAGEHAALGCRAARPTEESKAAAWTLMTSPDVTNRAFAALAAGFWTNGQEELVAPYLPRYLAAAPTLAVGQGMSQIVGSRGFPRLPLPMGDLQDLRDGLAEVLTGELPTVLRRSWNDRLDDLDLVLRVRSVRRDRRTSS